MNEASNRIERFFSIYESKNTIYSYKVALRIYFKTFYGEGDLVEQAERYFSEPRNYEEDIETYFYF